VKRASLPRLLAIGTAAPERTISQREAEEMLVALADDPSRERAMRAVIRRSGVLTRGASALGAANGASLFDHTGPLGPPTGERVDRFLIEATPIATSACAQAIGRASIDPRSITHLITASCTGFAAPGVEHALIGTLGLSPGVRRTNIGFMGCHAAVNALAVAGAFTGADAGARALVCCVEISSIHLQRTTDASSIVANALFADGAGAAVVTQSSDARAPAIRASESVMIPDTAGLMRWRVGDHGFEMTLGSEVPEALAGAVPGWVRAVLDAHGLGIGDIAQWALHPGGPRVLDALERSLELAPGSTVASREILRDHGNMSSATILFILQRLLDTHGEDALPLMALAFGPGLAGEALLLG